MENEKLKWRNQDFIWLIGILISIIAIYFIKGLQENLIIKILLFVSGFLSSFAICVIYIKNINVNKDSIIKEHIDSQCLKEYVNNDCYKAELKYIKNTLHTKYLISIAVGLVLLSFIIVIKGDTEIQNEFSMASTISSIILSSIAIFMSISSEVKSTYLQNQLLEISAKLSKAVKRNDSLNDKWSHSFDQKLNEISQISNELKGISNNVIAVKEKIDSFEIKNDKNEKVESIFTCDQLISLYEEIYNKLSRRDLFNDILWFVLTLSVYNTTKLINAMEAADYLNVDKTDVAITYIWGIIIVLNSAGLNSANKEFCERLLKHKNFEHKTLDDKEKVTSFHDSYKK